MTQFLKDLFAAAAPVSFGRFMALVTTIFVLGWDTANLVFAWQMNHHLPPGLVPLPLLPDPMVLGAQGVFMTLFYGVTKAVELKNPPQVAPVGTPPQPSPS